MATLFEIAARLQALNAAEGMLMIAIKATLILAIARLLLAAMPRAAAATKHLVATAALIAVGFMPVLSILVPAWNVAVARQETKAPALQANAPASGAEAPPAAEPAPEEKRSAAGSLGTAISIARATGVVPDEPLTAVERAMNVGRSTWKGLVVVAIAIVALLMAGQMLLGVLGVWFVSRKAEELSSDKALQELDSVRDQLALPFEVRLLRSSRISVPVVWGITRPILLLPADVVTWPEDRLRVVLLHELAHLKRFDGISLLLTRLSVSFFWFHPLAWSLERAGRSECERACDDLVLASGTKPSEYADHLLAIARSMPSFDPFRSVTLAMSRKSQLEGRLLSILQPSVARRAFSARGVAFASILAVAVLVPLSALRITAGPPNEGQVAETKRIQEEIRSDSEVTVTPDLDAISDFLLTKLGKYDKRADRYARQPRNGEEWYERAYDLYRAERYEEAATAFRRSAESGYRDDTALYNAACSYALLGDANRAIPALEEALRAGWDDIDHIAKDSDFDPIRSDPRFARVVNTSEGDLVTRRLQETVARYESLRGGAKEQTREDAKHTVTVDIKRDAKRDLDFTINIEEEDSWFSVGFDLLRLRKLDESIDAFQRAIAANERVDTSMYNIACAYSLKGDVRNGMAWLDKAIDQGFSSNDKLESDPDIALLRRQPGFDDLQKKARDLRMRGCCDTGAKWLDAFVSDSWDEAARYHREITNRYPTSGRAWFNLGFTSLKAEDYGTALQAFQRSLELGHRPGTSSYNIACTHALQGRRDQAFDWLSRAQKAGFDLQDHISGDDDLDSLHRDPRWEKLVAELDARHHGRRGWLEHLINEKKGNED